MQKLAHYMYQAASEAIITKLTSTWVGRERGGGKWNIYVTIQVLKSGPSIAN